MAAAVWWVLLGLYGLIVLRWLWGHVELTQAIGSGMFVPKTEVDPQTLRTRVTVVIAAHDEADTIGPCLERVLAQDYPELQVIVANDRSGDATGEIVRDIARDHANVRCIDIENLPEGWLGKTHALSVAARQAEGDWLVFTDSDVIWHPKLLPTVIDLAQRQRLDFLSLWPKVLVLSFWERLLLPACGMVLSLWFRHGRPDRIQSTPAFANGQFLMIRREAYDKIGGHAAVPDEMAEDVALARRARAAGLRRYQMLGRDLLQTRMYENLRQIVRGWTRIFIGALGARWKLILTIVAVLIGHLSPFVIAIVLATRAAGEGSLEVLEWGWLAAAAVHLPAMYSVTYRHFALVYEGGTHLLLLPVALLGVIALLGYCAVLIGGLGTIRWGNMRYRVCGSRAVQGRLASEG